MKRKVITFLLTLMIVVCQSPGLVIAADVASEMQEPAVVEEQQTAVEEQPAAVEEQPAESVEETVQESLEDDAEVKAQMPAADTSNNAGSPKDVYIDNTVDNSISYVTGTIHLTGAGGKQAGYDPAKTIYENQAAVTYSNPKTAQVQGMIDESYTAVYNAANDIKKRGKAGEFHMSTSESTGKVWDNRKYTTVEDGDAVLIGDSDYLQGAYGVNDQYTRTHIASGDYGKETFYRVEANGWVSGFDIIVSDDGNGTGSADLEASLAEETVTLTAKPDEGYEFKEWQVISGGALLSDSSASTTAFEMPKADVEIKAVFETTHKHTLVKTDKVDPTCEESGTEAYWTCSECGKMFSDAAGTNEIEAPAKIAATGHDWGEWIVDREATEDEEGEQHRICANDPEHVEVQTIPKIEAADESEDDNISGDESSSDSSSSSGQSKTVKTGDETPAALWSLLLAAALLLLIEMFLYKRRDER